MLVEKRHNKQFESEKAYLEELENRFAIVVDDQGRFNILLVRPSMFELSCCPMFFHTEFSILIHTFMQML